MIEGSDGFALDDAVPVRLGFCDVDAGVHVDDVDSDEGMSEIRVKLLVGDIVDL